MMLNVCIHIAFDTHTRDLLSTIRVNPRFRVVDNVCITYLGMVVRFLCCLRRLKAPSGKVYADK